MSRKLNSQQKQQSTTTWLLIFFSCTLLYPLGTHSSPMYTRTKRSVTHTNAHDRGSECAHDSIAELTKTSPVILKALGAHIFTDDDFNGMGMPLARQWANELNGYRKHNEFSTLVALDEATVIAATGKATATTKSVTSTTSAKQTRNNVEDINISETTATASMFATTATEMESILITLTPETIYKGASLLKMSPGSENGARSNSFGDSATLYDVQLNATLQPVHCFDANLLQLLPTELIVFGKLVTTQQRQQQQQQLGPQEPQQLPQFRKQYEADILHISINGFHRWSPQLENHIWKHLGWDDWSDFTLCSVTCGKGVQQRFRRCLLDNPMVNLNMNANLNAVEVNSVGGNDNDNDDDNDDDEYEDVLTADNKKSNKSHNDEDDAAFEPGVIDEKIKITNEYEKQKSSDDKLNTPNIKRSSSSEESTVIPLETTKNELSKGMLHFQTMKVDDVPTAMDTQAMVADTTEMSATDELRHLQSVTLTSDNKEHMQVTNILNSLNDDDGNIMRMENMSNDQKHEKDKKAEQAQKLHKKRKVTKSFSTMFCEGYNIEQRNCNMFECSDDISDLLKFYKRPIVYEDVPPMSPATSTNEFNTNVLSSSIAKTDVVTSASIAFAADVTAYYSSSSVIDVSMNSASSASMLANSVSSTTPANMGYIRSWHNPLNFTIMLTLRVKNDSKNCATIFSIRNSTHNLYLDQCQDGLRLYLERDNSTEMLPVKFNLHDYRWHQVSISIQNGDFISIYVDCSWTNSFVVSKRLFTLPFDADAEIGRGFNGELQQLLLMPDNQERHQCSNRRTSINEVKRYIIDTFIGDYSN